MAEEEGQKCYWTNDCDRLCNEGEYVAAESTQMMCNDGRRCPGRDRRTNKFCCSILQNMKVMPPLNPAQFNGPPCGMPGGIPCPNMMGGQQQQPMTSDCHWTEECGRHCATGEFTASESRRLTNGNTCNNRPEGVHRYCCKGPQIIWTSSSFDYH